MPVFFSPDGNAEVWAARPDSYFTPEAWQTAHPPVVPPAHIPTRAELFARLRRMRDQRLAAHDAVISQLSRKQRLGEDVSERLQALDAYAEQLCNLPAKDGAPWDGGGEDTPWPEMPALTRTTP